MSSNKISKKFNCRSNLMIVLFKCSARSRKKTRSLNLGLMTSGNPVTGPAHHATDRTDTAGACLSHAVTDQTKSQARVDPCSHSYSHSNIVLHQ